VSKEDGLSQDERGLAALAHGSVLVGLFTNGIGGIGAALVIWITQKEKSAYVAGQALQALAYQIVTTVISLLGWCCWGVLLMALTLPPVIANPDAYEKAPPDGLWVGLALIVVPLAIWGLTVLYGLYGALRSLRGDDFKYAIIGDWLESQRSDA
jgi:uncharacterized Tic20 family protein